MHILPRRVLLLEDNKTRIQKDRKKSKETQIKKKDKDAKRSRRRGHKNIKDTEKDKDTKRNIPICFATCLSIFARSYRRVNTGNVPPFKIFQI